METDDFPLRVFGPIVTVPEVTTGAATITGNTTATLTGTVNPDGEPLEECRFEYGLTEEYGSSVPCAETVGEIGTTAKQVHADLVLAPETFYYYRLVAKNANDTVEGKRLTFKMPSKPLLDSLWAADVGTDSALLRARINPENSATTYRLEWGLDTSYGNSTPELAVGSDATLRTLGRVVSGLEPGTTYHWRAVATNSLGVAEGPDRVIHTYPVPSAPQSDCPNQSFRIGPAARLPDCRAFELVSPVDKNGGDVITGRSVRINGTLTAGSIDGDRATFSSLRSFGGPEGAPLVSQYLARRGADGWATESISPPRSTPALYLTGAYGQYKAFSEDLCQAWLIHDADIALAPGAFTDFPNLYRRDNCGAAASYELISTPKPPGFARTGDEFVHSEYVPAPRGHSADGASTVFSAPAKLTPNACPTARLYQIYRSEPGGALRLVSALPGAAAACTNTAVGNATNGPHAFNADYIANAVSADATRVYWTDTGNAQKGAVASGPGRLYLRVNADQGPSKVAAGECTEAAKACTLAVSATANARFFAANGDGSAALYTEGAQLREYDLASRSSSTIATGVASVLAATVGNGSEPTRVYFTSTAVLSGEQANSEGDKAAAGEPNLYFAEGDATPVFIGTLRPVEATSSGEVFASNPAAEETRYRSSTVSPDGLHLAFTSIEPLTGYDNSDLASGNPDSQVFLYDAEAGVLRCVSCNPSGARPNGRKLGIQQGNEFATWAAGRLPGWTDALNPARLLSADGDRLFFESYDALVLADTNGQKDVYEWLRAEDETACEEAGMELFAPGAGGCLSLISSGQDPEDSELIGTGADGRDVFFITGSSLLPQDPGLIDVYDARAGGGFPQPLQAPACEGEACQGPYDPPQDPTPTSAAFQGAGNVREAAPRKKPRCAKPKVKRKGRCVAKKQKKGRAAKQRANGERRVGR